jgi:hypothetical protein
MDYSLRAVSQGKDALGEVAVKVDFGDGELVTGKGASTDVIEASARAYLNAVNRFLCDGHAKKKRESQPELRNRRGDEADCPGVRASRPQQVNKLVNRRTLVTAPRSTAPFVRNCALAALLNAFKLFLRMR